MNNSDDIKKFLSVRTHNQLASIFDLSYKELAKIIYGIPSSYRYKEFEIRKKSGGSRVIRAPCKSLKLIQRRLADILIEIYTPRNSVYGFVNDRDIVGNAKRHIPQRARRHRYILNIDLKDFFHSIFFGRIKRLFMARPFNFSEKVSTILAQTCCHKNTLPQGAPSSPILTNMICYKLDREFQQLAQQNYFVYTRYADDITFSFTRPVERISQKLLTFQDGRVTVGEDIEEIIKVNGFQINHEKVRFSSNQERHEVTGLTINDFPNVKRKYIRDLWSVLYAWQKFGYDAASETHFSKYYTKQRASDKAPELINVIRGRLIFLGKVRGNDDSIYVKLVKRFNSLIPADTKPVGYSPIIKQRKDLSDGLWIIETMSDGKNGEVNINQGSAFNLNGIGIVTCAHVLDKYVNGKTKAFKFNNSSKQYNVLIDRQKIDEHLDLAIVTLEEKPDKGMEFEVNEEQIEQGLAIILCGFPEYKMGQSPYIVNDQIASIYATHSVSKFETSRTIRHGNSGGPVLDQNYKVVGVAAYAEKDSSEPNSVISISELMKWLKTFEAPK